MPEYSEDAEGIPEPAVAALTPEDIQGFVRDQVVSDPSVHERVNRACPGLIDGPAHDYPADGDWTWDDPVALIAQSASKYFDGQPLMRSTDVLISGLPEVFRVRAEAGGSLTDAGECENPISFYAIYNDRGEDVSFPTASAKEEKSRILTKSGP